MTSGCHLLLEWTEFDLYHFKQFKNLGLMVSDREKYFGMIEGDHNCHTDVLCYASWMDYLLRSKIVICWLKYTV